MHAKKKQFRCDLCGKHFKSESLLNTHNIFHKEQKLFACKFCDKAFAHKISLDYHLRTHTGERPFKCKACNKDFISSSNLNVHSRIHLRNKPYASRKKSNLDIRLHSHTAGRSSKNKFIKSTHLPVHTNETFVCSLCNKSFKFSTSLLYHEQTHHAT